VEAFKGRVDRRRAVTPEGGGVTRYEFKGAAKVVKDPAAHGRIAQILGPAHAFKQVVKIRVETASEVFSPIYTLTRNSEAEAKPFWLERYGYRSAHEAGGAHDYP
jgi:hypothetical protein